MTGHKHPTVVMPGEAKPKTGISVSTAAMTKVYARKAEAGIPARATTSLVGDDNKGHKSPEFYEHSEENIRGLST